MKKSRKYFKLGDIGIYFLLIIFFGVLGSQIFKFEDTKGSKAEIYVNNDLKYVYQLTPEEKDYFVETDIGGVNIKIKDNKIRVTTSNSPLKLNVKQGWIDSPGQVIVGIPDKLIIRVTGEKVENTDDDVDIILR